MYDLNGKITDRREFLKIKLKSLAAEARIIRFEEFKSQGALRNEMSMHRRGRYKGDPQSLRFHARNTHIAYGLIRGKTLDEIEPTRQSSPDWSYIKKMIDKYGSRNQWKELCSNITSISPNINKYEYDEIIKLAA